MADRQRDSQSNLPYCVVTFDNAGLAAGTEYPRPFEERLKEVLNEPVASQFRLGTIPPSLVSFLHVADKIFVRGRLFCPDLNLDKLFFGPDLIKRYVQRFNNYI